MVNLGRVDADVPDSLDVPADVDLDRVAVNNARDYSVVGRAGPGLGVGWLESRQQEYRDNRAECVCDRGKATGRLAVHYLTSNEVRNSA